MEYYLNSLLKYLLSSVNCKFDFFEITRNDSLLIFEAINDESLLFLFIRVFEVNKCLSSSYSYTTKNVENIILKPNKDISQKNLVGCFIFAYSLIKNYKKSENLIFISTFLRLNDLLISIKDNLELNTVAKIMSRKFKIDKRIFLNVAEI